ncbi:hypothetical protein [Vibrio sp. Isolate24]|uniref:hypothetical protein n=1 Tax=Vibrio sp. Isolate24 TaxID=2908534 RepID=UPI001EFC9843|nr:hypothetical protein [Vibrio sp. Isolate24]MCG9677365.1 hypothetical protein [Vibrio sp. Isolate24]
MKRFFPSSVMLTPFVVKYYSEPEQDDSDIDTDDDSNTVSQTDEKECDSLPV